uniref:Uncharacterized protein n=1 Tax=Oryza nivara TaxID=4536 RepID=A0A0E0IHI3_ORYNI
MVKTSTEHFASLSYGLCARKLVELRGWSGRCPGSGSLDGGSVRHSVEQQTSRRGFAFGPVSLGQPRATDSDLSSPRRPPSPADRPVNVERWGIRVVVLTG